MSSNANHRIHKFLNGIASAIMILALCFGMSSPPAAQAREINTETPAEPQQFATGENISPGIARATTFEMPALVPMPNLAALTADLWHSCALTSGGGVKCWGNNGSGRLGDGTLITRLAPVNVIGLASGVIAITAGENHTCALTSGGGVKCWGDNSHGQLGDGTFNPSRTPVDVSGLTSGVSAISAGGSHTCAVISGGGAQCWGYNIFGQLGDNTKIDSPTPVDVHGLTSGVSAISAGAFHTCAVISGGAKCWGVNGQGRLGDNTDTERLEPVNVSGLASNVSAISAGVYHTCARTTGGGAKCWGYNLHGQLGDDTNEDRWTPVDVIDLTSGVSAISVGGLHTCALTSGGGIMCWGWNAAGQLGESTTDDHWTPVDVSGLTSGASAIVTGFYHTCALTTGGGAKCWGNNDDGHLGDGTTNNSSTPVDVMGPPAAPVLISPGGTISDTLPTYAWNSSSTASAYRIAVYSVGSASYVLQTNVPGSACTGGVCTYHPTTALPAGSYRFKVLASNLTGAGPYSAWMNFTIAGGVPPAAPILISPSGTITDTHPPYSWNSSSSASAYTLAVYSVGSASYVIQASVSSSSCTGGVCTYHPTTTLTSGMYRFKVLARNTAGASPYSAWMNFTVSGGVPPAAPILLSPTGTISDTHPPYSWNASSGATAYTLAVYSNGTLSYVIQTSVASSYCTGGVCTYHPSTNLTPGAYRFKVLARNAAGSSLYSAWMNFTVSP